MWYLCPEGLVPKGISSPSTKLQMTRNPPKDGDSAAAGSQVSTPPEKGMRCSRHDEKFWAGGGYQLPSREKWLRFLR